jgi:hypothetical protein
MYVYACRDLHTEGSLVFLRSNDSLRCRCIRIRTHRSVSALTSHVTALSSRSDWFKAFIECLEDSAPPCTKAHYLWITGYLAGLCSPYLITVRCSASRPVDCTTSDAPNTSTLAQRTNPNGQLPYAKHLCDSLPTRTLTYCACLMSTALASCSRPPVCACSGQP